MDAESAGGAVGRGGDESRAASELDFDGARLGLLEQSHRLAVSRIGLRSRISWSETW
jgi:hypothetical protein